MGNGYQPVPTYRNTKQKCPLGFWTPLFPSPVDTSTYTYVHMWAALIWYMWIICDFGLMWLLYLRCTYQAACRCWQGGRWFVLTQRRERPYSRTGLSSGRTGDYRPSTPKLNSIPTYRYRTYLQRVDYLKAFNCLYLPYLPMHFRSTYFFLKKECPAVKTEVF